MGCSDRENYVCGCLLQSTIGWVCRRWVGRVQGRLLDEMTAHFSLGDRSKGKLKGQAEWGWGNVQ